ncbi:IS110 family transposase [Myxococcota bacterium]|nr:IS110 family transposase [Myxococcota bacterium]
MANCAGVDVSKDHLDWTVGSVAEVRQVPNTPAGVRRLVRKLQRLELDRVVFEATGGYERLLFQALVDAGLPVVRVNPKRVRDFGKGLGILAKNDRIDARLLAVFGAKAEPRLDTARSAEGRRMGELAARRRQLVQLITMEKNRREQMPRWLRADQESLIRILEGRVAKIDALLDETIAQDAQQKDRFERLQTVPAVGAKTARAILADLPELGRLDRRKIAALAGLAPFAKDSGRKTGLRSIQGGRAAPRTALYLAALIASRFNPTLKPVYDRLRAAGKPGKVALVAVARKLLTILNAIVRDGTEWRAAQQA